MPMTRAQKQNYQSKPLLSQSQVNESIEQRTIKESSPPDEPDGRSSKRRRLSPQEQTDTFSPARSSPDGEDGNSGAFDGADDRVAVDGNGGFFSRGTSTEATENDEHKSSYTEKVDSPQRSAAKSPAVPSTRTRVESLPVLENLALQILCLLARVSHAEAQTLVRNPETPNGSEYATLRSLFDHTKRLYTTRSPFLSSHELNLDEPKQIEILRKANQAIFMSSIFSGEIGLRDMDRNFLDVFVPENGRLLKAQSSIFLELKTQAFVTAIRTAAAPPATIMIDLFPTNMDSLILQRRPGARNLAPSESDFLKRLSSRREILHSYINDNASDRLSQKYRWEDFSREVSSYLAKNFEDPEAETSKLQVGQTGMMSTPTKLQQTQMQNQFSVRDALPAMSDLASSTISQEIPAIPEFTLSDDFVAQAARAAEIAMQEPQDVAYKAVQLNKSPTPKPPKQSTPVTSQQIHPQFQYYNPALNSTTKTGNFLPDVVDSDIPHKSQTAPTRVLYEKARMVATAKSSPLPTKKAHSPSQRRLWTTEEENALMTGLDQVKGPHWSQILAMFGPGGTVSEALKDRNQVQLKDKARNLKLFFLKSGIEVPYYLKYVTGDLKTRAPTQASKQEARARELEEGEEAKARLDGIQGIMALSANNH